MESRRVSVSRVCLAWRGWGDGSGSASLGWLVEEAVDDCDEVEHSGHDDAEGADFVDFGESGFEVSGGVCGGADFIEDESEGSDAALDDEPPEGGLSVDDIEASQEESCEDE